MGFSSKELGIIIIEIAIAFAILFFGDRDFLLEIFIEFFPILFVIIVVLIGIGIILYKKIGEIDEKLDEYSERQDDMEKMLKRTEDLIEIKAESKYLKDKIFKIEEMIKNGS